MATELPEGASTARNQEQVLALFQNLYHAWVNNWMTFSSGVLAPGSFAVAPEVARSATVFQSADFLVIAALIVARKDNVTPNVGEVRIGDSANQYVPLKPGAVYELGPISGNRFNLAQWYVQNDTAYDGVLVHYVR